MTISAGTNLVRRPFLFRSETISESLSVYLPTVFASRFIGLVRGVVLAWLLTTGEFGLLQIALIVVNILDPFCSLGLNEALARYVPQYETKQALRAFLRRAVILILAVGLGLTAVVALCAEPIGRFLFATLSRDGAGVEPQACTMLTRIATGVTLTLMIYYLLMGILKGLRMFRAVSLLELVSNVTFMATAVLVALAGRNTAVAMLVCYGFTLLASALLVVPGLGRTLRAVPDQVSLTALSTDGSMHRVVERLMRFGVWVALAAIVWQTLQFYPMWYLQKVYGPEVTAVFGGVRLLTQAVLIISVAVVTVVQTSVTKTWEAEGPPAADRKLALAFKTTALTLLVLCALIAGLSDVLVRLFPRDYAEGARIVSSLLLFFMISGHLGFLAIHFSLIECPWHLFVPWTAGLLAGIVAGRWLVLPGLTPAQALQAAVWSGILGVSAAVLVAFFLIWIERRPVDFGTVLLIAATYALAGPIYLFIAVMLVLCVLAWMSNVIFTIEGKQKLRQLLGDGYRRIRAMLSKGMV